MARTDSLPHFLSDVADAIRTKKGSEDTIQASDFDTEIENLPGGGSVTPTNMSEFNSALETNKTSYMNYLKNVPSSYNTRMTNAITLYTPEAGFNWYIIQKRSSGNYRVVWLNDYGFCWYSNGIYYAGMNSGSNLSSSKLNFFEENIHFGFSISYQYGNFYISSEYTTLEECITKFLNNELTYSSVTNNFLGALADNPYIVPYTNCAILYYNSGILYPTERLSSNETIEVMQ